MKLLLAIAATALAQAGDVDALDRALLANPSATAVLQSWCDRAQPGLKIRALVTRRGTFEAGARAEALGVGQGETIAYRRVQLRCGGTVLSEADNWYVPARLTREMNVALVGDTPFGVVVRAMAPVRRNLSSERRWDGQRPNEVLRHRAVLLAAGTPIAEVVETYQRTMLSGG